MLALLNPFDPNTIDFDPPHEHRIYADDREALWANVDQEDYQYFSRWRWHALFDRRRGRKKKVYLVRSTGCGNNYKPKLFLHVEILKRSGEVPETLFHDIADHWDGDTLNCMRINLRWNTGSGNNRRNGR